MIATGTRTKVRDTCAMAFAHVGLEAQDQVVVDERYFRPAEVDVLLGNPAKARAELGWEPKTSLEQLVAMMVDADLARLSKQNGHAAA